MIMSDRAISEWRINLARLEGALPFVGETIEQILAMRSLRQLWRIHVRDFPFENEGLEHNPGVDADELIRSWYAGQRQDFLSWINRRAHVRLANAARTALLAKNVPETFGAFDDADLALARLDELLPSSDPVL
jgi:hypothetical protein